MQYGKIIASLDTYTSFDTYASSSECTSKTTLPWHLMRPYYFHIHKRVEKWLPFLISFIRVLSADSFLHSVISSMRSSRASIELLSILIPCLHCSSKCFEHVLWQNNSIPQHDGRGMVLYFIWYSWSMIGWLKCYITILKVLSNHKRRVSRVNANTALFLFSRTSERIFNPFGIITILISNHWVMIIANTVLFRTAFTSMILQYSILSGSQ